MKIIFIFACSGMFRNVPACSGMFHVPGFIDGPKDRGIFVLHVSDTDTFQSVKVYLHVMENLFYGSWLMIQLCWIS